MRCTNLYIEWSLRNIDLGDFELQMEYSIYYVEFIILVMNTRQSFIDYIFTKSRTF